MVLASPKEKKIFTVNYAAARFERTTGRIRQICIAHDIGTLIEGRVRLLTASDVEEIGRIIKESGQARGS